MTIHVICSSKQSVSLAVSVEDSDFEADCIDRAVSELEGIGTVTVTKHMSIISVVGHKMRNVVEVHGEYSLSSIPDKSLPCLHLLCKLQPSHQAVHHVISTIYTQSHQHMPAYQATHQTGLSLPDPPWPSKICFFSLAP